MCAGRQDLPAPGLQTRKGRRGPARPDHLSCEQQPDAHTNCGPEHSVRRLTRQHSFASACSCRAASEWPFAGPDIAGRLEAGSKAKLYLSRMPCRPAASFCNYVIGGTSAIGMLRDDAGIRGVTQRPEYVLYRQAMIRCFSAASPILPSLLAVVRNKARTSRDLLWDGATMSLAKVWASKARKGEEEICGVDSSRGGSWSLTLTMGLGSLRSMELELEVRGSGCRGSRFQVVASFRESASHCA